MHSQEKRPFPKKVFGQNLSSQNLRGLQDQGFIRCASDEYNAKLLEKYPNMMGSESAEAEIKAKIKNLRDSGFFKNPNVVIQIPVVVHVLHNGEPVGTGPNISDAQVISQITVMNEDFRKLTGTPGYNDNAVGADMEIEFVLAQRTPDGCPTNGINRVNICQDGTNSADVDFWKAQTYWNPADYMNMWSSKYVGDLNGILGFAQFPGGPASTDGVSASYNFFGSSDYDDGTFELSAPYDKGRTMTHEVGHYVGLWHTFQGGCFGGDEVDDTPPVSSPNYGCPEGADSCIGGDLDMIENYMDYTDDTCMNTYTEGQKERALVFMTTYTNRMTLSTSDGDEPLDPETTDAEVALVSGNPSICGPNYEPTLYLTNWGTSTLTSATISYDVDGGASETYEWTGSLGTNESELVTLPMATGTAGEHTLNASISAAGDARTCNDESSICMTLSSAPDMIATEQVHLDLTTDNYGDETTWTFSDSSGTVLYSGGSYANNTDYSAVFDVVPGECYTFSIYDAYGDGICCSWGEGSYTLTTDDDTVIYSGGEFDSFESVNMLVESLSIDEFTQSNISLFPNPTSNALNIKVSNGDLPDNYTIYNVLGQVVSSKSIRSNADLMINTSEFSNGMYFIKINKNDQAISIPFIKE